MDEQQFISITWQTRETLLYNNNFAIQFVKSYLFQGGMSEEYYIILFGKSNEGKHIGYKFIAEVGKT